MTYLARYAHLKYPSSREIGDKIKPSEAFAVMGNTGKSTGPHLHFDLIQKEVNKMYRLADIPKYITDLGTLMQQYYYFLDDELFDSHLKITTPFCEWAYYQQYRKWHYGYDLVPVDKNKNIIFWNRSYEGKIHMTGTDPGYGNFIIIKYTVV